MNLNISQWKIFKIKDLFDIVLSKGDIKIDDVDSGTIPLVSSGEKNNGIVGFISEEGDGRAEMFKGNLITVDMFCNAFYQKDPFYAVSHGRVNILLPKIKLTQYIALFICSLIKQEQYKFSYGRAVYSTVCGDIEIKLPILCDKDKTPIIDKTHAYSSEGYIPDWQFMENYIKSLHHKPLTTKNKNRQIPVLNEKVWKEFLLNDYFDIYAGKYHYPEEYNEGSTPYYSASNENNGIGAYIDLEPDFEGNCIVTGKIGCTAFYVPNAFCATSDVNIYKPKFHMSRFVGLFISTIINFSENYKWAYGRQCRVGDSKQITIKFPVDAIGNPDWQFMENYIKSLPYGDRI